MQLEITKQIPIMRDFPKFIDYLEENEIKLTNTKENLKGPTLYELNQVMSHSVPGATKRSRQRIYPVLHLFYHLAVEGRLFKKEREGSKVFLRSTPRLVEYKKLTLTEKYFFLLETLWIDCDWDKLQEANTGNNPLGQVSLLVEHLKEEYIDQEIDLKGKSLSLFNWGYFLVYFEYFGFWEVTYQDTDSKTTYRPETIKLTKFGYQLLNSLVENRDLDVWNLPQRRGLGDFTGRPGAPLTVDTEDDLIDELLFMLEAGEELPSKEEMLAQLETGEDESSQEDQSEEEFIAVFKSLFSAEELTITLPREEAGFKAGTYLLRIASSKNNWCQVKFRGEDTLEAVHQAIADNFEFTEDHLYAFFLDGEPWSNAAISCPQDEGPTTTDFKLGELNLKEEQEIMYIFDYGAECRFQIKVLAITDEIES